MSEASDGHTNHGGAVTPPSCSTPLSCHRSLTRSWLLVGSPLGPSSSGCRINPDEGSGDHLTEMWLNNPPSGLYEELFCTSQVSIPLVPLAGALMVSSRPMSDVVKEGYLGKLERSNRRYFVLRAGSHTGPSRLEWYKSQEKFTVMEKSARKAGLCGSNKQGVIYLRCCLGVSRIGSSRKGHTLALYDKDQTLVLLMEDQEQQEEWYAAIKSLVEEEQKDEEHAEGVDEDDGYCTLPPAAFFKEVWSVMVKPRGLGSSKHFTGEIRLCLTATALVLVRLGATNDFPSVTIPLLSVRRFGHLDGLFFMELGRSAPNGPGEIWMEAREEGDAAVAQHIHEAVRGAVQALRALPDFSRSPTSSHHQQPGLLASKRCRPKYRDKSVHPRPLTSQTSPAQSPRRPPKPDDTKSESCLSFTSFISPPRLQRGSEPDRFLGSKTDLCGDAASRMQRWESVEKGEGLGYMLMSPQVSHSLSELVQEDYVVMESPQKPHRPTQSFSSSSSSSSLQTSFSSSTFDGCSPPYPSQHQDRQPSWRLTCVQQSETEKDPSETSCSAESQDDAKEKQNSAQMKEEHGGSALTAPFDLIGSGSTRPPQYRPNCDGSRSSHLQAVQELSPIRRYWPSMCLLACLHVEDNS
ncbi:insulin receptor substrate 1-B isoform X2 [Nothobranchius furzeri]|uniref:Transcript variant X3 n=1 Tax=Nothobranchius furzeri TaxID=105023 RepID=A0A9D2Y8H8_NOTFU|nr:insulin receptor substrate 1-B isoform X2 [Nothobranchius furzeri]KAF7214729.1 transcript variant X3 [Nothobranchius furzeri]